MRDRLAYCSFRTLGATFAQVTVLQWLPNAGTRPTRSDDGSSAILWSPPLVQCAVASNSELLTQGLDFVPDLQN